MNIIAELRSNSKLLGDAFSNFSLKNIYVKHALKVSIAGLLALVTAQWLEIPNGNWAAWTATTVMLPNVAASLKKLTLRFLGTWVAFIVSLFLFGMFFQQHIYFTIFYGLFILFITYKRSTSSIDYFWWIQGSVTIVVTIGALASSPDNAIYIAVHRTMEISIGVFFGFVINFWLWPNFVQEELHTEAVTIRDVYFDFFEKIFISYINNDYNLSEIKDLRNLLLAKFEKVESKLSLSLIERKIFRISKANYDVTVDELQLKTLKLWRFYKSISRNNITAPRAYNKIILLIIKNLKLLNNNLYSEDISLKSLKMNIIQETEKLFIKLDSINLVSNSNLFSKVWNDREIVLFNDAKSNLHRLFFYFKEIINGKTEYEKTDEKYPLIIEYSHIKSVSMFGISYSVNIPVLKSSFKTALCFIISLWFLFYFEIPIGQAGILMLFAPILYMNHNITDSIKFFIFIIGGSLTATALNLAFMALFPDSPPILYITAFIVVFFFAFLRTNPDKAIQHFSIWGLVGFLSCQVSGFAPTSNPWPVLTSLVGATFGLIFVYIIDNVIWKYEVSNEFEKNNNALDKIFDDLYNNFQAVLMNKKSYFNKRIGMQILFEQVTSLFNTGKISESKYKAFNRKFEILRWIFFDIKSLLLLNNKYFNYLYRINPSFFENLFNLLSSLTTNTDLLIKPDARSSQIEIKKQFSLLKAELYQSKFYIKDISLQKKYGECVMIIRSIIELIHKYEDFILKSAKNRYSETKNLDIRH